VSEGTSKVGVGTVPSQQVVATSGRNDARAQVEGDGFWALAIHRPFTSLSDALASHLIVSCVPKLKESDKNKASVLILHVPTDALKI
jgi:hypothetical protein